MVKPGHQRVVLAKIPHQLDRDDALGIGGMQRLQFGPGSVATAIIHEDDFERSSERRKHVPHARVQQRQRPLRPIHRHHDRNIGPRNAGAIHDAPLVARKRRIADVGLP